MGDALLWLVGKRRSDTMIIVAAIVGHALWLVGKRRSDTIHERKYYENFTLWLVGKRRSDTIACSGSKPRAVAVVGREASFRYNSLRVFERYMAAVVGREASFRYNRALFFVGCP